MLRLAPHLLRRGVVLRLAAPPGDFADAWGEAGFAHTPLHLPKHLGLRPTGDVSGRRSPITLIDEAAKVASSALRIARLARQADVIHSNSLFAHVECAVAGKLARRPVVLELHDLVAPGLGRRLLTTSTRLATRTIAISEAVAFCVSTPVRDRVDIVPQGVDTARFWPDGPRGSLRSELGIDDETPLIGILGRVDPEKGIGTVIDAVARMQFLPLPHLVVIGDPFSAGREHLDSLARRAHEQLGDRARFLPSRSDIPAVLRSLDILVNASDAEPFGLTVLEAQASGTPIVATDAGGIPEFVTDGINGLLVPPRDPAALAGAIGRLLDDEAFATQLTGAARERVVDRYSLAGRAAAFESIYRRAAGSSEPAGSVGAMTDSPPAGPRLPAPGPGIRP